MIALVLERLGDGVEVVGGGIDGEAVLLRLEVGGARVERVHHDGVLVEVAVFIVDDDDALLVEHPRHAAGRAEAAAEFVEVMAHVARGAVAVVGHCLDDHGNAAGAVALVGDGLVGVAAAGGSRLFQHALDVVVRHVGRLGLCDGGGQTRVVQRVGDAAALLDRDDHFLGNLRKRGGALGVLRALRFLDVMPLGMSGHRYSSLPEYSEIILSHEYPENQLFHRNCVSSL